MTLNAGDYALLIAIMAMPLGLVTLYLRAIRAEAIRFQVAAQKRLDEHEQRLQVVEQKKVGHEDWVRVVVSQQRNIELTRELVKEISGKLDATIGIGGNLKRVADSLEAQNRRAE